MKYFQELKYEEISQKYWEHPLGIKSILSSSRKKKIEAFVKVKPLAVKLSKTYYENI
jgi:hypothetical protein